MIVKLQWSGFSRTMKKNSKEGCFLFFVLLHLNCDNIDEYCRFRMWPYQFNYLVSKIRHELEPQTELARQCAINSSGSWVRAELKIAATLRVLAGGSYLDAADLYAVSASSFHRNTFWPVVLAICNSRDVYLDNVKFPFDDENKLRL